jgi:hypothetical protein
MVEIKHSGKSMAQRVADRLRSSGDGSGAEGVTHGEGPTRTATHIHHNANVSLHGGGAGPDYANDIEARVAEDHRRKRAEGRC